MTDIVREIHEALEQLRATLENVRISDKIRNQVETLLTPLFANPSSEKRITAIINEIGDFTENILVPMLEQYVSANVAIRVKFLIEDLLVFIESYRDKILKKLATGNTRAHQQRVKNSVQVTKNQRPRLTLKSATAPYRIALLGDDRVNRARAGLKKVRPRGNGAINVNGSFSVVKKVAESKKFNSTTANSKQVSLMPGIIRDTTNGELTETLALERPALTRSGQVLVKIIAVGLNPTDLDGTSGFSKKSDDAPHVAQLAALGQSFLGMSDALLGNAATDSLASGNTLGQALGVSKSAGHQSEPSNMVGQEFVGVVKDISWTKGDLIHRRHVAREDTVYGFLKRNQGASSGSLAEYVVCDIDDVARVSRRIASHPLRAAKLPLDGAVVANTLAHTDVIRSQRNNFLIIGAGYNTGLILIELLHRHLKLDARKFKLIAPPDHLQLFENAIEAKKINLVKENLLNSKDDPKEWFEAIENNSLDVIFDCSAPYNEFPKPETSFETFFEKKLKPKGQFFALDPAQLISEKARSGDNWTKELQFLTKLVNERNLTLNVFDNPAPTPIAYSKDAIGQALEDAHVGEHFGKLVVDLRKEQLEAFKKRNN